MRLHPAALLLPAVLVLGCSSSKNTKPTPTATAPSAPAGAATAAAVATVASTAPAVATPGPVDTVTPSPTVRPASAPTASPVATAAPKDETPLAKQLLLTVHDFPTGYTEKPSSSQSSSLDKLCPGPKPVGETGKAQTGEFTQNNGNTSVSEVLAVYDTAEHADMAFSVAITAGDCIVKAINAGKLDDSTATYSGATFTPVSFPRFGDRSTAFRLQIHAKVKGQTGFGSEADAFLDLVYGRDGRIAYSVDAEDVVTPFDSALLQQVVTKADALVRRGLGLPAATAVPQ